MAVDGFGLHLVGGCCEILLFMNLISIIECCCFRGQSSCSCWLSSPMPLCPAVQGWHMHSKQKLKALLHASHATAILLPVQDAMAVKHG